jgi:CheY-like chemotaxis protein
LKQGKIVLLIDDDKFIREIVVFVLETEGYKVIEARDGQEGIELLISSGTVPDLILIDLNMPVMTGQKFLHEIEASLLYKDIPIIAMSSDLSKLPKEYKISGRLPKPIDIPKLLEIVQSSIIS